MPHLLVIPGDSGNSYSGSRGPVSKCLPGNNCASYHILLAFRVKQGFNMSDSIKLLTTTRFRPFFLTQLLGAFNDNLYKNGLTIFIAFQVASVSQEESSALVNVAAALFILPFFLFSPIAGQLADKHEKSMLIRYIKLLEIGIMLLGAMAFVLESTTMLVGILFLAPRWFRWRPRPSRRSTR